MPKLHNDTNTSISIGGVYCPAESLVHISNEQAQAIAPSLHGVEGFRVEYEQPEPATLTPKRITKPLRRGSEEENDQ